MSEPTSEKLDTFAILDLFGHQQIAGRVADVLIAGAPFVRVDVPATSEDAEYTRYYHPNAIYSIAPVSEEAARAKAMSLHVRPIQVYELPKLQAPAGADGQPIKRYGARSSSRVYGERDEYGPDDEDGEAEEEPLLEAEEEPLL